MRPIKQFQVLPSLPPELEPLRRIAYNLRWTWSHDSISLFRRLDAELWEASGHNPVLMLGMIDQERLQASVADPGFLAHLSRVADGLDGYVNSKTTWCERVGRREDSPCVAYFSAEFGLTDAIPTYSGGLGVLAGDYLKSASDLGLPLVGIGLLYQEGYFRQYLNVDGWQQESYPTNDFYNLPVQPVHSQDGNRISVEIELPGRKVTAQIWRVTVGRIPLYLLDTNVPDNAPEDQDITDELYGGDTDMRIRQEILLGIGGVRALAALGLSPKVGHMNDGHPAFSGLERARLFMAREGLSFAVAREIVSSGSVFTTHTPLQSSIDRFAPSLIDKYFKHYWPQLGLTREEFLGLGRENPADDREPFCMTALALKMASFRNGVSRLHGTVARSMWQTVWPNVPQREVPIGHVTNGAHYPSWVSHDMAELFHRYLGPKWLEEPEEQAIWDRVNQIPAEELWRTHQRRRERLVAFARSRLRKQLLRRGTGMAEIERAEEVLSPQALTIGFARRFATYKRATLILQDPERLARILNNTEKPVQIIFAGKAHPKDDEGKQFIKEIVHLSRASEFQHSMVFIEDYDMAVARYMVQGADVWLSTPRRYQEASGTSGMKAAPNGVLNVSILDGWWDEAYNTEVGWTIGSGEVYEDLKYQDKVESEALYELLEKEIIPIFYERGRDGLPRKWIARMKSSMRSLGAFFNSTRVVHEYATRFYFPAMERVSSLSADGCAEARALADWGSRVRKHWGEVRVVETDTDSQAALKVGSEIHIRATLQLGNLAPQDVNVDVYFGKTDAKGHIPAGEVIRMQHISADDRGIHRYEGIVPCRQSGQHGFTVRVLPAAERLTGPHELGLVAWA